MIEKRKEIRYTIPEIYQTHMKLKIRTDSGEVLPATLLNVSLRGISVRSSSKLVIGSMIECSISAPKCRPGDISFCAQIHYCLDDKASGDFRVGAEIVQTSEKLWVNAFFQIHNFIEERLRMQTQLNHSSS